MLGITGITNNKDIDREILLFLPDKDLLVVCGLNKYFYYSVCDDNFFYRKLLISYPDTLKEQSLRNHNKNYKFCYLKVVYYVFKLQTEFNYFYRLGNLEKQYNLFLKVGNSQELLIESIMEGEIELVKETIKRGVNIHHDNQLALRWASAKGHFNIIKYLIDNGANISAVNEQSLILASSNGHLEIIGYLVCLGANIHINNERALKMASAYGHLEIVQFLVSLGANFHIDENEPLKLAIKNEHLDVVKYLRNL